MRARGNTGPFPPWTWNVEPWPWHYVDGTRYCDEHGVYQCRFCETAYLLAHHRPSRPARELLDIVHDAYCEGFVAGLESSSPTLATEPSAEQCWSESMVKAIVESPGLEYIYNEIGEEAP